MYRPENTSSVFELFLMYGEGLLTIKAKTPTSHSFLKIQPFTVTILMTVASSTAVVIIMIIVL